MWILTRIGLVRAVGEYEIVVNSRQVGVPSQTRYELTLYFTTNHWNRKKQILGLTSMSENRSRSVLLAAFSGARWKETARACFSRIQEAGSEGGICDLTDIGGESDWPTEGSLVVFGGTSSEKLSD